jgi:serine/threonine protein kinase
LFDIARITPGTLLGKGGAGAVRAVDRTAIKRVVFDEKYLYKNVDNVSPLDTYEDEIGTLMRLKGNPYVLQLLDSEKYNHNAYMTTERLSGMNLRYAIFNNKIDNRNVRKVVEQLVTGLQSIHDAGILHLDIKPENIWFTPGPFRGSDPSIKYLDFGDSCGEIPCIKDYSVSTKGYALKDRLMDDGFYYDKSNDYYALAMTINDLIPEEDRSPANKEWFHTIITGFQSLPGV